MYDERLQSIEDMAAILLNSQAIDGRVDEEAIPAAVEKCCLILPPTGVLVSLSDREQIEKRLQERFNITMELGLMFSSEAEYRPWLDDARGSTTWYYWGRYKRLLEQRRFPAQVVASLDDITDTVLDHLQDPNLGGTWNRKGLVVGHVQSGKTANYIGLIAKAADAGYKVIIVLAGLLNSLRNQTQERIDSGFVGRDTSQIIKGYQLHEILTGVGALDHKRFPASLTSSDRDFNVHTLKQLNVSLDALNEPIVCVLKKNVRTFENVIKWLKINNEHLQNHPVLLIDDEADHASINTSADPLKATAINSSIRTLLKLFPKCSYVGYTATPFANVFIDPDSDNDMFGDDLFPRDFILNLSPPSNYVSPERIFSETGDLQIVREINDYGDELPLRHRKDWRPPALPTSLRRAIQSFVIIKGLRILRGQLKAHNSMMINVTRFTDVQSTVKTLVHELLQAIRQAITNNYALDEPQALKNSHMKALQQLWSDDFDNGEFKWVQLQRVLKEAVSPVSVIEVNSSRQAEPLDYSEHNYPNGRNVIAVGGLSLSRGLTLEGLTVSYFLRNSVMYDTLMQMGRWFGYRDGYVDLCRLYMTPEAASWYRHIAEAMEELREEFSRMKRAAMTPRDFGLAVRNHPESLIVTARNKMRTGTKVLREVSLEGRLIETSVLLGGQEVVGSNLRAVENLVERAGKAVKTQRIDDGYFWPSVNLELVKAFLAEFENHPASQLTENVPVESYLDWLSQNGVRGIDIVLLSPKSTQKGSEVRRTFSDCEVLAQRRKASRGVGNSIEINKRRVASRGQEKVGLTKAQIAEAESCYIKAGSKPDYLYRRIRKRPLLMLHLLDVYDAEKKGEHMYLTGIAAWGMSFPGEAGSRIPKKLVEYTVNTTWWKQHYLELVDDEEDEENA